MAHQVALALRDWLPDLIHRLEPWVSSEDIAKGQIGLSALSQNLQDAGFGIICVTAESVKSPWVNFEAGAMANKVGGIRVTPVLVGITEQDLSKSPLTQLQHAPLDDKGEMLKLATSLLAECPEAGLTPERLRKNFDRFWPDLEPTIEKITAVLPKDASPKPTESEKLDELLGLARQSQRRIDRLELAIGPISHWEIPSGRPAVIAREVGDLIKHIDKEATVEVHRGRIRVQFSHEPSGRMKHMLKDIETTIEVPVQWSWSDSSSQESTDTLDDDAGG